MPKPTKQVVQPAEVEVETVFTRELNRAERFYIDQNLDNLSSEEIGEDLDVPTEAVEAYIAKVTVDGPVEPKMFERSIAKKKHGTGGAVIMTEGASEQIDEAYKNIPKKSPEYVFQPKTGRRRRG